MLSLDRGSVRHRVAVSLSHVRAAVQTPFNEQLWSEVHPAAEAAIRQSTSAEAEAADTKCGILQLRWIE